MGDEVDEDAVNDVKTGLDFAFLFTVVSFNAILAIKQICRRGLLSSTSRCLILSLAAGGAVVAVFAYTNRLRADIHFKSKNVTHAIVTASCALFYYLPFVYAVTLIALGADILVRRSRGLAVSHQVWRWNLAVVCLPWAFGAVVVYPLVTTNIDWDASLQNDDVVHSTSLIQFRITLFVCNVLPLCLAFGLSLALYCPHWCRNTVWAASIRKRGGRLVNAVTESETFQTLSHKGRYDPFGIQAQDRSNAISSNTASDSKDDEELREWILSREARLLLACTFIAFACSFLWPVYQFLQTYNTYQPIVSTSMNVVSFYLSQLAFILLPSLWIWSHL